MGSLGGMCPYDSILLWHCYGIWEIMNVVRSASIRKFYAGLVNEIASTSSATAWSCGNKAIGNPFFYKLCRAFYLHFSHHILPMTVYSVLADEKRFTDLLTAFPLT